MVDFGSDTVASQEGMDRERKIKCRTVLGHGFDFAFRGEYKYFGCKQIKLDCV